MKKESKKPRSSILIKNIELSEKASRWLEKSMLKCQSIDFHSNLSESQFDAAENLASRFARLTDILINKVFRSLDDVELEPQGAVLDVVRRAAKRGLGKEDDLRQLKELRNAIAHEYADEDHGEIFGQILEQSKILLKVLKKTQAYIKTKV